MHGKGCFKWANGDEYIGDWKLGHMHGQGKKKMANGDSYDGDWKTDRANGQGLKTFACGDRYVHMLTNCLPPCPMSHLLIVAHQAWIIITICIQSGIKVSTQMTSGRDSEYIHGYEMQHYCPKYQLIYSLTHTLSSTHTRTHTHILRFQGTST